MVIVRDPSRVGSTWVATRDDSAARPHQPVDQPAETWTHSRTKILARRQSRAGAVVFGCEPVTWMTASMSPPFGTSEYDLAGAYRGSPVDVVELR